jgi:hypothetical protein
MRSTSTGALAAFRRRVDAFFGDPRAAELVTARAVGAVTAPTTAKAALGARLGDVVGRLDAERGELQLRKSFTLHDGRVVAMSGDSEPLDPAADLRIVTTTTTVLDADRMRVETSVLVFDKGERS